MKNLAIIPARSGSKGLKDKNILPLNGRPLLSYSILAAAESGIFDEVMVSTDSEEYALVARECGASVPFLRSSITSGDKASSWDAVQEVLDGYSHLGRRFDMVTLLQPTSPLRTAKDLRNAYRIFEEKRARGVVSLCEMDHSPLWSNTLPEDASLKGFLRPEALAGGRQQLQTYYRINGAIYMYRLDEEKPTFSLYEEGCYAYVMPRERSVDIDTFLDFKIAECILDAGGEEE